MCIGNRAEVSSHFINGQLRALYENAIYCAKKHLDGLKPTESVVEYATCLAEFYGPGRHVRHEPSRQDLAFFATFDRPRIEFVCNHEVVLFLTLNDGHYNLDTTKFAPKRELHESIQSCTIAFRIPFSSHAIEKFHCKAIGNADHYTSILHVLDMDSATFVPEHSFIPGFSDSDNQDERSFSTRDRKVAALTYYLAKFYLPTIRRAGHHVLYSLPDFDNLTNTTAHIDYSVISTRALATDTVFGIRVEDVNVYLRGLWLQAAASLDEYGHSIDHVSRTFLAELRLPPMDDVDDMHMHMYFAPLHVQPLCKREVILYLDVQDIHVHFGGFSGQPREQLRDWKIAFIVDIVFEETDGTKRIKLDLQTARFCEHLSVFGEHHDVEILFRIKTTLIRQITTYYLNILETSEVITIFHYDINIHGGAYGDTGGDRDIIDVDGCSCQDEGSCGHIGGIRWGVIQKRILTQTHTSEYDLITALTQGSINLHLNILWESARRRLTFASAGKAVRTWESTELELETCLVDYSFVHPEHNDEVFFAASFEAPKIQLVCKEGSHKVIFHLHLSEGYLKTLGSGKSLQPGSNAYPFSNWRLAFEVDLKIIDSREDTTPSAILKRLGLSKPTGLKQLVLALSTARLNLSLSTIPGLLDGTDYRAIRARREALVYYIQTCYFPALKRAHHHVLYTLPQGVPGAHNHGHMLTSLQFEIVPFIYAADARHREGIFGPYQAIFDRNAIVIMGMTCGRSFPHCSLPRGVNWVCGYGKEVPLGTAYLSRKSFLDGILLKKLGSINRETTIVPTFSGIKDGKWVLQLAAWDDHAMKKDQKCKWREISKDNVDSLEFEWKNKELWRYEHDDDFHTSGTYTVDCITHNVLSIPTNRVEKSVIHLNGAVKLYLKYEGTGKDWNSEMSVHWSANITFISSALGLQVQLHPARIVPDIRSTHVTHGAPGHETQKLALEQLKQKFPNSVDFAILLRDLKEDLEGMWAGVQVHAHEFCVAHPVFNRHGDLLLELMVRGSNFNNKMDVRGGYSSLNNERSVMSLNGGVTPVDMNGNGNATSEHWFRHAVYKAGDVLQSYSPSISRMSSSSKITSTTFVSQETITRQSSTAQITSDEHEYSQSDIEEEEL